MDDRHHSYDDSQILEIKDNLIGLTVAMVICKHRWIVLTCTRVTRYFSDAFETDETLLKTTEGHLN